MGRNAKAEAFGERSKALLTEIAPNSWNGTSWKTRGQAIHDASQPAGSGREAGVLSSIEFRVSL